MWFLKWILFGVPISFFAAFGTLQFSADIMAKKYELTPTNLFVNYIGLKDDYLNNASEEFDVRPDRVDLEHHKEQFWGQDVALQPDTTDIAYHDLAMGFSQEQRNVQFLPLMVSYWVMLAMGGVLFHGFTISKKLPARG